MPVRRVAGRRGGAGEFLVASASQPGVWHEVWVTIDPAGDPHARCDAGCPGYAYRGRCRHAVDVEAQVRAERRLLQPALPSAVGVAG